MTHVWSTLPWTLNQRQKTLRVQVVRNREPFYSGIMLPTCNGMQWLPFFILFWQVSAKSPITRDFLLKPPLIKYIFQENYSTETASYCNCSRCVKMPSVEESCCCTNVKYNSKMPEGQWLTWYKYLNLFISVLGKCVLDHTDYNIITNKTVLEINLKTVWSSGWKLICKKNDSINEDSFQELWTQITQK